MPSWGRAPLALACALAVAALALACALAVAATSAARIAPAGEQVLARGGDQLQVAAVASVSLTKLPRLRIDASAITVSGISSGADFAVQFHVAHSAVVSGVGVFAGQPYRCSATMFPDDEAHLEPSCTGDPSCSVPVCDNCPANATLQYDHCKWAPERVDPRLLAAAARAAAEAGLIDELANLADDPVYIYRGTRDQCYLAGAEERVVEFYRAAGVGDGGRRDGGLIAFEGSVPSLHAQPTIRQGSPCGGPYAPSPYSYLANCGFDGAGAVLQHVYRGALKPPAAEYVHSSLQRFDQSEFDAGPREAGLAKDAFVYVPRACAAARGQGPRAEEQQEPCRLHVYMHGCSGPDRFYNASVHFAGFNEWAETSRVVVLYPALRPWGATAQTKVGCWDGYGQTGADFSYKTAPQMLAVRRMIQRLAGV